MSEKPIPFRGPMVNAILAGNKSQTRRLVNLPPGRWKHDATLQELDTKSRPVGHPAFGFESTDGRFTALPCPYGGVGSHLWVRETYKLNTTMAGIRVTYRADGAERLVDPPAGYGGIPDDNHWRPPVTMPRWASRLTLEVTKVRVERVQDITEADAKAEGVEPAGNHDYAGWPKNCRIAYAKLWDTSNGKTHPWSSNPWVWVIAFKRVQQFPEAR